MPTTIGPPAARYAHAVLTTGAQRWLHTSGVVPVDPSGAVPDGIEAQARVVWDNIAAMLTDAGMDATAIVSMTTYVVEGQELGPVMAVRDGVLGDHVAASTLVVVPRLAQPAWLVEVAVVAAV